MSNHMVNFTVAAASRVLQVEKKAIKEWAYFFSDYLSPGANPPKGVKRIFQMEDIRVMAFVFTLWEQDPDIEYIKMGLNANSHYENELIDDLLTGLTPFFTDPPENMDETWKHGIVFGGLSEFGDTFYLANSYKKAGDQLIDAALETQDGWSLFCPAIYNYRHATELYMKAITGYSKQSHNLIMLFNKFKELLQKEYNTSIPDWFKNIITALNDFDPGGTTFRYGESVNRDEVFIDFVQLKTLMGWMGQSFQNIRRHQGMPDAI